jgi:hypothetical protein
LSSINSSGETGRKGGSGDGFRVWELNAKWMEIEEKWLEREMGELRDLWDSNLRFVEFFGCFLNQVEN